MDYSRCCLVFGITPNLAFALGTFVVGFLKHHPDWSGDVHVFHSGLAKEQMNGLRRIWPRTSFQSVDERAIESRLLGAGQQNNAVRKTVARYSTMYFAKFEMFDLLQKYEKCAWFDVDMVVQRPVSDVWDFQDVAWRPVLRRTQAKHVDLRAAYAHVLDPHPVPRPNGGLICASSRLWSDLGITAQSLYDLFSEIIARKPIVTGDEMALMLLAASQRLHVRILPMSFNCPSGSKDSESAHVVHSIGRSKFWNDGGVSAAFPAWKGYYAEWVAGGGERYAGSVDEDFVPVDSRSIINASRAFKQRRASLQAVRKLIPSKLCPDPFRSQTGEQWFFLTGMAQSCCIGLTPQADEDGNAVDSMDVTFELDVDSVAIPQLPRMLEEALPGFVLEVPGAGRRLTLKGAGVKVRALEEKIDRFGGVAVSLKASMGSRH